MKNILPRLLLCALLLTGCVELPGLTPLPPPTGDDDDDASLSLPETATFALAMNGEVDDSGAPSIVLTKSGGMFQFLYWAEGGGTPLCRQRFLFQAEARFGPLTTSSCGGCSGSLSISEVSLAPPDSDLDISSDGCDKDFIAGSDLSFLLTGEGEDENESADFGHLALIKVEQLLDQDWNLSQDGVHIADLVGSYKAAGLTATHLAMVRPSGWLGQRAGLDDIASPWGVQEWLPMFVVYRDADRPTDADWLPGEVFMTSLWQVGLAALPPPPSAPGGNTTVE